MANVSNIQTVDISELIPYENNAKIHDKKQIEKLKESIKKFGFLTPVLIDKDKNIIAGHGRTKAAVAWEKAEKAKAQKSTTTKKK